MDDCTINQHYCRSIGCIIYSCPWVGLTWILSDSAWIDSILAKTAGQYAGTPKSKSTQGTTQVHEQMGQPVNHMKACLSETWCRPQAFPTFGAWASTPWCAWVPCSLSGSASTIQSTSLTPSVTQKVCSSPTRSCLKGTLLNELRLPGESSGDRASAALITIGPAIFNGGTTTFLASVAVYYKADKFHADKSLLFIELVPHVV